MSNINNFDKIIKDKLGNYAEVPPAHLWGGISAGIAASPIVKISFYKTAIFKIGTIAATIVLLLGSIWFYNSDVDVQRNIEKPITTALQKNTNNNSTNNSNNAITNDIQNEVDNNNIDDSENSKLNESVVVGNSNLNTNTSLQNSVNNSATDINNVASAKIQSSSNSPNNRSNAKSDINLQKETPITPNSEKIATESGNISIAADEQSSQNNNSNIEIENSTVAISETTEFEKESSEISEEAELQQSTIKKENDVNKQELAIEEATTPEENNVIEQEVSKGQTPTVNENTNEESENAPSTERKNPTTEQEVTIENPKEVSAGIIKPESDFNPKTRNFDKISIGVHYGLEFINIDDINITSNNLDFSFNYQNLSFIAQTGIGVQFSKDKNNYNTKYISNDYIATEYRFDSLTFIPDGNGGFKPQPVNPYYKDIYDSVNHTLNSDIYESYYSIRVPLMIGYQKSYRKFALITKGGLIYSHIVYNRTGETFIPKSNARIIGTDYIGSNRKSNQLQYVLSGGLTYAINRKLFFNAELMGKYYQYSLYKNSAYDNVNPWSFEARIGFTYLLN